MDWWIWVIVALIVVLVVQIIVNRTRKSDKSYEIVDTYEKKVQYKKKNFLTRTEKDFLAILRELSKYNIIVVPQVNLATIIQKTGKYRFQSELYRNIDFGIFDREYNLLLLIELNDSSHQQNVRKSRDIKVKDISSQAGIKLITFYTNKPNKSEYVINRILNELGIKK